MPDLFLNAQIPSPCAHHKDEDDDDDGYNNYPILLLVARLVCVKEEAHKVLRIVDSLMTLGLQWPVTLVSPHASSTEVLLTAVRAQKLAIVRLYIHGHAW
jgi:hypothetical protein